jgi:predicted DNA-binding transcriptional regulator YafY
MSRKEETRPMLNRIYFIDREIASGKYPNTRQLAKAYEAGTATISRDIEFLRDMMGAPIEYDSSRKGYYYSDKSYRLPGAFISSEELLALGIVKNLLSLYRETPIYGAARKFLDGITSPLNPGGGGTPWYEDRIIVPPVPSQAVREEIWNLLLIALRENRVVTFDYRGLRDSGFRERRTRPYQLLFNNGLWYLYAYSEEPKALRVFSVSRIKNPKITAETFKLPEDYDYRRHSRGGRLGIYTGEKTYRFRIALYDEAIPRALECRWAEDQKVETGNGEAVLDFTGVQFEPVFEWVMAQGYAAKPLEPPELVEVWRVNVERMAKML